jgi:hypothetical protein
MTDRPRDAGYDDFLDALAGGEGYYLESPTGDGYLPPRDVDPRTGDDLTREPLPSAGEIEAYSTTEVPPPSLADDAPYTVAIASFGPVRLTGQFRGDDADLEVGMTVEADVGHTATGEEPIVVFRPR